MDINEILNDINNYDENNDNDNGNDNEDKDDNILECNKCNSNTSIFYDGGTFCIKCGELLSVQYNQEQEYRYYGENDSKSNDPTRVGMPINNLLPKSSMGTSISTNTGRDKYAINRIIQYHQWYKMPYEERSLYKDFEIIASKSLKLSLPPMIIEESKRYYKKIREQSLNRGSNRRGLEAACIYFACKKEEVPRSSKEIAKEFDINIKDMSKGIKKFTEIMYYVNDDNKKDNITISPIDFINRYCSKLNLNQDIKYLSEFVILKSILIKLVEENTPSSIAAGCIYLVCMLTNQNINKQNVSNICNVSEVTIGKCYKKMYDYKNILLPKSAIIKYNIE